MLRIFCSEWFSREQQAAMLRIGIVGVGFMGYTHFEGARSLKGARVTAIATRDKKKLAGNWTGIQGNFGPPGGHVDLSKIKQYSDYRELLADPEIDLVDSCLPTESQLPSTCRRQTEW